MSLNDPMEADGPVVRPSNGKLQLHCKGKRTSSGITWSLDDRGGPPSGKIARVDVPRDSGPCEMTIHLSVAGGGGDVSFQTADPIWATTGTCPPPPGINTDQIGGVSCADKKLVFTALNHGSPQRLMYQLNFRGADPLDPELKTGGGTKEQ